MLVEAALDPILLAASLDDGRTARRATRADEDELVLACQRGEREAFSSLVERYQRDVYRLCYRYVNNHHDASDMAQEAFLKAFRAIHRFRGDSSFSTWLYRIAVNTCLNFRQARRTQQEPLDESWPDLTPPVAETIEQGERAAEVRAAIARLPEKQRATLILKLYHELTHEEVARILGSSVGTVKANLFHAINNLRKLLAGSALALGAPRPEGR
jgi:RNA polymerase sigma-70 factor (ECF subfamily)